MKIAALTVAVALFAPQAQAASAYCALWPKSCQIQQQPPEPAPPTAQPVPPPSDPVMPQPPRAAPTVASEPKAATITRIKPKFTKPKKRKTTASPSFPRP